MKPTPIDWNDPKYQDPMEELYAIRHQLSEQYDFDIRKLSEAISAEVAHAKALGMTYLEYCMAKVNGSLPLFAHEDSACYDPKIADSAQSSSQE